MLVGLGITARAETPLPANRENDKSLRRHDRSVKHDFTDKWITEGKKAGSYIKSWVNTDLGNGMRPIYAPTPYSNYPVPQHCQE